MPLTLRPYPFFIPINNLYTVPTKLCSGHSLKAFPLKNKILRKIFLKLEKGADLRIFSQQLFA
jgi:hypothetical protein